MPKCEFCDITLKSDLNVSRHLVSQTHRDNVKKATDLHPLEKSNLKDTPNNIVKVFETLKLRTVKDVRDLADRGYFRIPENSPGILSVADGLVYVFLKCIAEHKTRNLPQQARKIVMDSFEKVKDEPRESKRPESSAKQTEQQPPKRPAQQPEQRHQSNQQNARPEPAPTRSPPPKRRPADDPRPGPAYTPVLTFHPANPVPAVRNATPASARPVPPQPTATRPPVARQPAPRQPVARQPVPRQPVPRQPVSRLEPQSTHLERNSRPPSNLPPPEQMPMTGASFMPRRPIDNDSPPRPRLDSTYQPKLAKIKVEPSDH
jgi:hypothetical protein